MASALAGSALVARPLVVQPVPAHKPASLGSSRTSPSLRTPLPVFVKAVRPPLARCRAPTRISGEAGQDGTSPPEAAAREELQTSQDLPAARFASARSLVALLAAGALILAPTGDALAAQGGGRIGGSAFSAPRAAPRAAPRSSPRIDNSGPRTNNIFINPGLRVAPPVYGNPFGGYGYGGYGYGGSPFSYYGGPSLSVGIGGGGLFSFIIFLMVSSLVLSIVRSFLGGRRDEWSQ